MRMCVQTHTNLRFVFLVLFCCVFPHKRCIINPLGMAKIFVSLLYNNFLTAVNLI